MNLDYVSKSVAKKENAARTQREGFEPPEPCGSSAFEADAISQLDHRCMTPL